MSDIKRVGLRVPIETYLKLEEMSKRYGIAVSNLINFIVAQWLDSQLYVREKFIDSLKGEVVEFLRERGFDYEKGF